MMHRFFIPPESIDGNRVVIVGVAARQIKSVLRMSVGIRIAVLDNSGWEYDVEIVDITRTSVAGEIRERSICANDPELRIVIYQAVLKGSRMDYVVQKCTEVGVAEIVPVLFERCVAATPGRSRVERWRQIIQEAAEQSGAGKLPELGPLVDFAEACRMIDGRSLIPWEDEVGTSIKAAIAGWWGMGSVNIIIGPEGGLTEEEVARAREAAAVPVSLGRRLLRAETAGLVAATAVLYETDQLRRDGST